MHWIAFVKLSNDHHLENRRLNYTTNSISNPSSKSDEGVSEKKVNKIYVCRTFRKTQTHHTINEHTAPRLFEKSITKTLRRSRASFQMLRGRWGCKKMWCWMNGATWGYFFTSHLASVTPAFVGVPTHFHEANLTKGTFHEKKFYENIFTKVILYKFHENFFTNQGSHEKMFTKATDNFQVNLSRAYYGMMWVMSRQKFSLSSLRKQNLKIEVLQEKKIRKPTHSYPFIHLFSLLTPHFTGKWLGQFLWW